MEAIGADALVFFSVLVALRGPCLACRNRQEAMAKRKDARIAAVIITERFDKKAAKYATPSVPVPFNSKDTYERSIRQPLGRDFNTDSSFRSALLLHAVPFSLPVPVS